MARVLMTAAAAVAVMFVDVRLIIIEYICETLLSLEFSVFIFRYTLL